MCAAPLLDSTFVAKALGLSPLSSLRSFSGISTDTRTLSAGALYIALHGDRYDGHDFIATAIKHGALGVICEKGRRLTDPITWFEVSHVLEAYRKLAFSWRERLDGIPMIAVAGSVGKTTTKDLLAALLSQRFKHVLKTEGSRNGFIGIPMTLLELRESHQIAVIEVGIDEPGAMLTHANTVRPTHALVTTIAPEHLSTLHDMETIAREECVLLEWVTANGTAYINLDDPAVRALTKNLPAQHTIGFTLEGRVWDGHQVESAHYLPDERKLRLANGECFALPLEGAHHARNLLAALTIARSLGLSHMEMADGLKRFKPAFGRADRRELPGPVEVLCDFYNASPASVAAAIDVFKTWPSATRRIACLGDMLELGPDEEKYHRELAPKIMNAGIDRVYLVGKRMGWLANELLKVGFKGHVELFESSAKLAEHFVPNVNPGDQILIKGSRGIQMERIWELLHAARCHHEG